MASAPTDHLYPPLTADLVRRERFVDPVCAAPPPRIRRSELVANAKLFTMTWAGGVVFLLTFIG